MKHTTTGISQNWRIDIEWGYVYASSAEYGAGVGHLFIRLEDPLGVLVEPFQVVVVEFNLHQHLAESIDRSQAFLGQVAADLGCQIGLTALVQSVGQVSQHNNEVIDGVVSLSSLQIAKELLDNQREVVGGLCTLSLVHDLSDRDILEGWAVLPNLLLIQSF